MVQGRITQGRRVVKNSLRGAGARIQGRTVPNQPAVQPGHGAGILFVKHEVEIQTR